LASLGRIVRRFGPGLPAKKSAVLAVLARSRLDTAGQLRRLHELLCFMDAYPDNRRIRGQVRRMLNGFSRRPDLRRHRRALAGTGIAGTDTPYRFFWPTAQWISQHWPDALVLDRKDEEAIGEILAALPPLLEPAQSEWLIARHATDLEPVDRLLPSGMTDADFLIGLIAAMPGDDFSREAFGDRLDMSYVLRPGHSTPERTTARFDWPNVAFQESELLTGYPDLRAEARRGPQRVRALRSERAVSAISLARVSMITRERDVAAFQFANRRDVFLVEDGQGLAFATMGMIPVRRATLPAIYTALTLKNGVPIGYIQVELLGQHGALSFNTFETFRGAEAARVFGRFIATAHQLFGCTDFSVEPYQLGAGNDEGIDSGAWWFYHRLGFRPRAAPARRIAAREHSRRAANPRYRSSPRTLRRLAQWHLFYSLDPGHKADLPRTGQWLAAATAVSRRYNQRDPDARREAMFQDASARVRLAGTSRLTSHERAMLGRWAALIIALTSRGHWSDEDRKRLLRLVCAKAGSNELVFQQQLLRHARLRSLLAC
jgi:hypothetical protein